MNVDYAAIGQRIKQVRRSRGLTQERLAEALSVSVGYISQMERGVTKINLDTLAAVSSCLGCELSELVTGVSVHHGRYLEGIPVEGSHFITGAQLGAMTVSVDGASLERGVDYVICDADGQQITQLSEDERYEGFQIKFQPSAVDKVRGKTIAMQYYSTVDYAMLEGGLNYTIHNIGKILDKTAEGAVSYEKPERLVKEAGDKGFQGTTNNHYREGGVTVD